ncbi:acyl carrier protein [Flavobacterium frigidarium]|uniref:acyl carrier protein n=1 Tax=Flavobacterium frigidarium TaxID=99286 RepID=UPI0030D6EB63
MELFIENFKSQLEDLDTVLTPETDYVDSDFWDSLTAITIQMMIDDEYGVKIDVEELSKFKSVAELYQFVEEKK